MTPTEEAHTGTLEPAAILSVTRRFAEVIRETGSVFLSQIPSKIKEVMAGDKVLLRKDGGTSVIDTVLPRRNALVRTYRDTKKNLAANVDHLFVMSAVSPLFNTTFIDRIFAVASAEHIPYSLVVNKADLGLGTTEPLIEIYKKLPIPIHFMSAKFGEGIPEFVKIISDPEISLIVLAGISGVGKSTLLNKLIPGSKSKTAEVSEKTGQGKQTTSLGQASVYPRESSRLLIVDLPGVQSFGVSHLSVEEVKASFTEFQNLPDKCGFDNCSHIREEDCAVKKALEDGTVAPSRYESYLGMIREIEEAAPY